MSVCATTMAFSSVPESFARSLLSFISIFIPSCHLLKTTVRAPRNTCSRAIEQPALTPGPSLHTSQQSQHLVLVVLTVACGDVLAFCTQTDFHFFSHFFFHSQPERTWLPTPSTERKHGQLCAVFTPSTMIVDGIAGADVQSPTFFGFGFSRAKSYVVT